VNSARIRSHSSKHGVNERLHRAIKLLKQVAEAGRAEKKFLPAPGTMSTALRISREFLFSLLNGWSFCENGLADVKVPDTSRVGLSLSTKAVL